MTMADRRGRRNPEFTSTSGGKQPHWPQLLLLSAVKFRNAQQRRNSEPYWHTEGTLLQQCDIVEDIPKGYRVQEKNPLFSPLNDEENFDSQTNFQLFINICFAHTTKHRSSTWNVSRQIVNRRKKRRTELQIHQFKRRLLTFQQAVENLDSNHDLLIVIDVRLIQSVIYRSIAPN